MKRGQAIYLIIPFISIIFGIGILNYISKDKEISEAENRALQQKPTIENIKDKSYTTTFESYYTDQFVGREELLKLDTKLQIKVKKSTIKDNYITEDGWLLGGTSTYKHKEEDYKDSVDLVEEAYQKASDLGKEVYYVSLPHKVNILDYKYPKYIDHTYGRENKDLFLSMLDNNIKVVDTGKYILNNFSKEKIESFYFKTDHHWNSLGAFEAFRYLINEMNNNRNINVDLNNYKYKTSYIKNVPFIGSYNRNLFNLFDTNEDIPYVYMDREYNNKYYMYKDKIFEEVDESYIIGDRLGQDEMTYGGAYTGNQPYYKIINEDAITQKKILILRDSYQAPLTWLLSDVFYQVEIVDTRYLDMTLDEILEKSDSDIFMMMYNDGSNVYEMLNNLKK